MRFRIAVSVSVLLGHILTLNSIFPHFSSASSPGPQIAQLQVGSSSSASQEFIELVNHSDTEITLAGWQIKYRAATAITGSDCALGWTTKATVSEGKIAAAGRYLFASSGYLEPDTSFNSGLSGTAGTIRLLDATGAIVDALAWGLGATCGTGTPSLAPPAGQSLERHSGVAGETGDNATDFSVQQHPAPQSSQQPASPEYAPADTTETPAALALELTELLVDPVSPSTDAQDEFVEIHNPGTEPAQVAGYIIQTGSHQYRLPAGLVAPNGYMVVTSGGTNLSLSNSGGVANLLDPSGQVIDTAGAWGSAVKGASWAYFGDGWRWTLAPTPGAENEYAPLPGQEEISESTDNLSVELTELLPDPASPLTDASDEYIEIFNPNASDVNLAGYVLKVGHDLASSYVIKAVTIPAGGHFILKSATSKLALSNSGSSVALYTPDGSQLGATITYPKAQTGAAWARFSDGWNWTATPTPGATNDYSDVDIAAAKAVASAKATKSAKAKAAAAKKGVKVKAAAKPKIKNTSTKPLLAGATTAGGRWLLFVLAALTIGYIIYEFRYDLRNYYYKIRGYPIGRPAPVKVAARRGSHRIS